MQLARKLVILTVLFAIMSVALPLLGLGDVYIGDLYLPPSYIVEGGVGLIQVTTSLELVKTMTHATALSVTVLAKDISYFGSSSTVAYISDECIPQVTKMNIGLEKIIASLASLDAEIYKIIQSPGSGDPSTMPVDLKNISNSLNDIDVALTKLTGNINIGTFDLTVYQLLGFDNLCRDFETAYENLIGINSGLSNTTGAVKEFRLNEGKKFKGWFRTVVQTSGIIEALNHAAQAMSDLGAAISDKLDSSSSSDSLLVRTTKDLYALHDGLKNTAVALSSVK